MAGMVHDHLAGLGELGKDGAVEAALIYGEHTVDLRTADHDIGRLQIGQGQRLHIDGAALTGTQSEHIDIAGGLGLH